MKIVTNIDESIYFNSIAIITGLFSTEATINGVLTKDTNY